MMGERKSAKDDSIDWMDILQRLKRRKSIVLSVMCLVVAVSIAYALLATPFYLTTTKFVYQSSAKTSGGIAALASLAGVSLGGGESDASQYLGDIVNSTDLLLLVLEHEWPMSDSSSEFGTKATLEELWHLEFDTTEINWKGKKDDFLLKRLREGDYINFAQDKKSGVVMLSTEFEDALVSLEINKFLLKELNNVLLNKMQFKAKTNREFIGERLSEVKKDLQASENALKAYRLRNRLRLDPGDALDDGRLQREMLMNQEIMLQLQKQFEIAKIDELKDMPVLDVIDSPREAVEKSKPKRRKIVAIGLLVGLFLGCGLSLLYDYRCQQKVNASV